MSKKDDIGHALKLAWEAMNYLGNILNSHDMVQPEDEAVTKEAFEIVPKALTELQKQPPAGDFTKRFRAQCEVVVRDCGINQEQIATVIKNIGLTGVEVRLLEGKLAAKEGLEACVIINQQAEDNKNQAAEIKWLKKRTKQLEQDIKMAYGAFLKKPSPERRMT